MISMTICATWRPTALLSLSSALPSTASLISRATRSVLPSTDSLNRTSLLKITPKALPPPLLSRLLLPPLRLKLPRLPRPLPPPPQKLLRPQPLLQILLSPRALLIAPLIQVKDPTRIQTVVMRTPKAVMKIPTEMTGKMRMRVKGTTAMAMMIPKVDIKEKVKVKAKETMMATTVSGETILETRANGAMTLETRVSGATMMRESGMTPGCSQRMLISRAHRRTTQDSSS